MSTSPREMALVDRRIEAYIIVFRGGVFCSRETYNYIWFHVEGMLSEVHKQIFNALQCGGRGKRGGVQGRRGRCFHIQSCT